MVGVCISENLEIGPGGLLRLARWSVPRVVADVVGASIGDGPLLPQVSLPGKLMINQTVEWTSDSPLETMVLLRVHRSSRSWVTSNPNAVQLRDRWSTAIDATPEEPLTTSVYNSQVGGAMDLGTDTVAQPRVGKLYGYADAHLSEEWIGPVQFGQTISVAYRAYVWTPPPFSDNANANAPEHSARAGSTRLQLIAMPTQGTLVAG